MPIKNRTLTARPSAVHILRRRRSRLRVRKRRSLLTLLRRGSSKSGDGRKVKKKMEDVNLKLYLENRSIIEENERLREKASLLRLQNQMLLSQLQHKRQFDAERDQLGSVAVAAAAVELAAVSRGRHCRQTDRSHDVNQ